jgi:valyl-tRNA synthetase
LPAAPGAGIVVVVRTAVAILVLLAALSIGACGGDSKADKAKTQVCDARADISKQLDTLKGLDISTATTDAVQTSLKAISDDLKTIAAARGDLDNERRSQVQQANQAFESQVQNVLSTLGSSTSLADAKTQLSQAFQQLGDAYDQTFAKIDCS